MDITAALALI